MSRAILKGNASGTGSVTLESPNTNTDRTISLPDATGTVMVSGNMPAFSAYTNTTQSISQNTWTKVNFSLEEFDTNNNFASNRFTPTVAGYYQLNTAVNFGGAINANLTIYKNGSAYRSLASGNTSGTSSIGDGCLVYANGSTDYFEIYVFTISASVSLYGDASGSFTWFNGCLARTA